jgi:hypothetical protein
MGSVYIPVEVYVDKILLCTMPKKNVDGLLKTLKRKGIKNVDIKSVRLDPLEQARSEIRYLLRDKFREQKIKKEGIQSC